MAKLQSGQALWEFQSNNSGEYISSDFKTYLKSSGILHCTSTSYTPQQNSKAEHSIRTILECTLLMLCSVNLLDRFWQDAVETAVHLINQSTCTGLKWMMPEESWSGTKPNIANLRVFSCTAYVLILKELCVGKLAHKTQRCVFIGYSSTRKAWWFWNPAKHSIIESRDAVFDECVQCCGHPLPLVNLSSLEDVDGPDKTIIPSDASPVTDSDISTTHPAINPCLAVPLPIP